MIQQAIASDDPVIFFEPKRRYWEKAEVDRGATLGRRVAAAPGAGSSARASDVTVAAYGPMVKTCLEAATAAAEEGRSIEVVDLRSLSPLDIDTVAASVEKTGRLVVVHEAPTFLGIGAEVAARVTERCFYHLEAPVLRVGGFDTPYPPAGSRRTTCPTSTGCSTPSTARSRSEEGGHMPDLKQFRLPDVGEGLTEAEIVTWQVKPGDTVQVNDIVVEIETAKSLVELPSPFAGVVAELLVAEGTTVDVGTPIIAVDIDPTGCGAGAAAGRRRGSHRRRSRRAPSRARPTSTRRPRRAPSSPA